MKLSSPQQHRICKRWLTLFAPVLALFSVLLTSPCSVAQEQGCQLRFAVSERFAPYHIALSEGRWDGLSVRLFTRMAEHIGCQVVVVNAPWSRALHLLANGEVDALSNVSQHPQRAAFARFIGPMAMEGVVMLGNKAFASRVTNQTELLLAPMIVGITQGTFYDRQVTLLAEALQKADKLVSIVSNHKLLEMLKAGRIDAFFEESSVAQRHFVTGRLSPLDAQVLFAFPRHPVFFAISQTSTDRTLQQALAKAWQAMLEAGEVTSIYRQFGLTVPVQVVGH
ncbi:transporter substrate-binding domain-containing protein [Aestuariibacter halophilus]|uniref:Transporter substrate-binding domain-containing protein n=1 Tax=Fluctibacter halophilus TaxID=226011 RepID=A0ABS8GBP2_9ALTE|nr:transporter substrate-binding domain-containing protein [Aestuariibacter halophilus]MCC2617823.1 transporter substrate-binding domain-containing protein [Aestuariibacter halophilus]